jgi:hypothetical protein
VAPALAIAVDFLDEAEPSKSSVPTNAAAEFNGGANATAAGRISGPRARAAAVIQKCTHRPGSKLERGCGLRLDYTVFEHALVPAEASPRAKRLSF